MILEDVDVRWVRQGVPKHHGHVSASHLLINSVDHFTLKNDRPSPQAAFLSHVHRDHMVGLETYNSSFVYCSKATYEVLHLQRNVEEIVGAATSNTPRSKRFYGGNKRTTNLHPLESSA
jgi:phosphoribosyl 1,2-cyclic phosphodiesterase